MQRTGRLYLDAALSHVEPRPDTGATTTDARQAHVSCVSPNLIVLRRLRSQTHLLERVLAPSLRRRGQLPEPDREITSSVTDLACHGQIVASLVVSVSVIASASDVFDSIANGTPCLMRSLPDTCAVSPVNRIRKSH